MHLALRLTEPQVGPAPIWELIFERQTIGRGADCTIALQRSRLSRVHATIFRDAQTGEYAIEPDPSAAGAFLNSQRMPRRSPLRDGDSLVLGTTLFKVFRAPELTAAQLDEARRAQASDVVFSDWLESVNRVDEAAWLRARRARSASLAVLTARLSANERAALANAPLRGCTRAECPREWARLELTPQARLRSCAQCKAVVPFCTRAAETTDVTVHVLE